MTVIDSLIDKIARILTQQFQVLSSKSLYKVLLILNSYI